MILQQSTIKYKGYDPLTLKPKSNKRICCSCDKCGRVRWVAKQKYTDLCKLCSIRKIGFKNKGKKRTNEVKEKMSKDRIGKNNHFYGKHHSEESKEKIGNRLYPTGKDHHNFNKPMSDEQKIKLSANHQGISVDKWEKFIYDQPYCEKWTEKLREEIRNKYNRKCFICNKTEKENGNRKLSVHHINKDKQQGCNGKSFNLVPLCSVCHSTIHNELWNNRLKYLLIF